MSDLVRSFCIRIDALAEDHLRAMPPGHLTANLNGYDELTVYTTKLYKGVEVPANCVDDVLAYYGATDTRHMEDILNGRVPAVEIASEGW